jgi:Protein of unknown function (DUF3237)
MNRRILLATASTLGAASWVTAANPAESTLPAGARAPAFELFYECDVTLSAILDFGATIEGKRRVIPITGGSFHGPAIRGNVVPGGADWNLQRSDGGGSVEAAYFLRTDDDVMIRIVNTGVSGGARPAPAADAAEMFFMYTHPVFEAPAGKYDWINRSMFVGTLGARKGANNAVLIRVFKLV